MLTEYRLNDHEILAPRVERRLDEDSWNDVRDFSKELHGIESTFIPELSNYIDLSIFSSREFADSYRNSPSNSKIRSTSPPEHLSWLSDDMGKIPEFNKNVIADIEDIIIKKVGSKLLLGMKLNSGQLVEDRKAAAKSIRRLTRVFSSWNVPDLIFGRIDIEEHQNQRAVRQVQEMALLLLKDDYFDIGFEPGTVDNHIVPLFD